MPRRPDLIVTDRGALGSDELLASAQAVAGGLRARGVRRGDAVGVATAELPRGRGPLLRVVVAGRGGCPVAPATDRARGRRRARADRPADPALRRRHGHAPPRRPARCARVHTGGRPPRRRGRPHHLGIIGTAEVGDPHPAHARVQGAATREPARNGPPGRGARARAARAPRGDVPRPAPPGGYGGQGGGDGGVGRRARPRTGAVGARHDVVRAAGVRARHRRRAGFLAGGGRERALDRGRRHHDHRGIRARCRRRTGRS